jgi:putative SOS response-associated peptidase YedK
MCGRYTHKLSWKQIVELYRLTLPEEPPENFGGPSYNVAPTHVMPIIRPAGNGRELLMATWGLVPFWSKPEQVAKPSYSTINARSDRIRTAPTYREAFENRRCLVPASGWYEWQATGAKRKRPFHVRPKTSPFAFAAVYDVWKGEGRVIASFAIVVTDAARGIAKIHPRMPVVLDDAQFDEWMRGTPDQAAALMKPYAGELEVWEVSVDVGNVRNNWPELMEKIEPLPAVSQADKDHIR